MIFKMADTDQIEGGVGVSVLQKCKPVLLSKFLHRVINRICDKGPSPLYDDYKDIWALEEWWDVTDFCEKYIKDAGKQSFTKDEIIESLMWLPGPLRQTFCDAISARHDEIRQHLARQSCLVGPAVLTDFDWQVKLVMSSDKMASLHEPLVNLDLSIDSKSSSKQTTSLELDRASMKATLASLEAANKVVQQLRT